MQVEKTRRCHSRPSETAKPSHTDTPKRQPQCGAQERSFTADGNEKCTAAQKDIGTVFIKLNIHLPYNPTIMFLGITQKSWKLMSTQNMHTNFYSRFIDNSKTWKQQRCASECEWINILWYIQTMRYYSVPKINKLSSHKDIGET